MSVRKSKPVLITLANHKGIEQSNTSIKICSISKYMLLIHFVDMLCLLAPSSHDMEYEDKTKRLTSMGFSQVGIMFVVYFFNCVI